MSKYTNEKAFLDDILEKLTTIEILLNEYSPFGKTEVNSRIVQEAQDNLFSVKSTVEYMRNPEFRERTLKTLLENNLVENIRPGKVLELSQRSQNVRILTEFSVN